MTSGIFLSKFDVDWKDFIIVILTQPRKQDM